MAQQNKVLVVRTFFLSYYYYVHVCFVYMYILCNVHPVLMEARKMSLDPLELELWMVVIHHEGAGNPTQVLWKNSQCLITKSSLQPHKLSTQKESKTSLEFCIFLESHGGSEIKTDIKLIEEKLYKLI